jgi:hypothetical protein
VGTGGHKASRDSPASREVGTAFRATRSERNKMNAFGGLGMWPTENLRVWGVDLGGRASVYNSSRASAVRLRELLVVEFAGEGTPSGGG